MFQTNFVDKIKTRVLYSVTPPPRKPCRLWYVEKYCTAWQDTDDNITRRIKYAIGMPDNWGKNTDTHSECLIPNTVNSITIQFLARQRCKGNPLLRFRVNNEHIYSADSYTYANNNKTGRYWWVSFATKVTRTRHAVTLYVLYPVQQKSPVL
jgi:hypothetical protein